MSMPTSVITTEKAQTPNDDETVEAEELNATEFLENTTDESEAKQTGVVCEECTYKVTNPRAK